MSGDDESLSVYRYVDGSRIELFKFGRWAAYYPTGIRHNFLFWNVEAAEVQMKSEGFCVGGLCSDLERGT